MTDFLRLAEAWVNEDRAVLDALSAQERRALGLIAIGEASERELEAAGDAFVRGVKQSPLPRWAGAGAIVQRADQPENTLTWTYSDETVDRAGDIVRQNWELKSYRANPVVLWGHGRDTDIPIGRTVSIGVEGRKLIGTIEFAVNASEDAAKIYRLARGGFVSAGSVGFRPLETRHVEDQAEREKLGLGRWGAVYERSELLEFSLCAVPCNPNAVQEGLKARAIQASDADLLASLKMPTERDLERAARRRARLFGPGAAPASDATPSPSIQERDGGTLLIVEVLRDLRAAMEDDAAARRMLARSITDFGARLGALRAVDSARPGADAGRKLTEDQAKKIQEQLKRLTK